MNGEVTQGKGSEFYPNLQGYSNNTKKVPTYLIQCY